MSNYRITPEMTTPQAMAACAREFRELNGFVAIDYEQTEKRYGRADGQPIEQTSNRHHSADVQAQENPENILGTYCVKCPVLSELGQCAVRERLQGLAAEHRAKFELAAPGIGSTSDRDFQATQ